MTGSEVAIVQSSGSLAVRADQGDWTEEQKAALAQIGVAEAPRGDQLVFLHVSQRMQLDPFNKEIYMIGRWDPELGRKKWTIQVGIDGFRSKSAEHPEYAGVDDAEWCGDDGKWVDVWLSDDPPKAARFTVYRRDQDKPTRSVAHYREYVQTKKDGKPTHRWATAPAHQLAKCAEALARRTAFPRKLGGVYLPEELDHLDNSQPPPGVIAEAERVDRPAAAEPDWDALITEHEAERDVGKLWDLRKLAQGMRPNDGPLLNKIAEAWQRTKKAAATPPEPAPAPATPPDPAPARPTAAAAEPATQKANASQRRALSKLLAARNVKTADAQLRAVTHMLERDDLASLDDLTAEEISHVIGSLESMKQPAAGRSGAGGRQH